jgi:uncharacterized membrane protein YsdA (DUF1294 family)
MTFGILTVYIVASVAALVAYRVDKTSAENGTWRTRESTLHLLALAGGWPGALLAQRIFHHKTRKRSFRLVFFATIVLNVALVWLWLRTST